MSSVARPQLPLASERPPAPAHVQSRLETVFDELADLALAPNVASALELASDVLEAELPSAALVAGLHDIDNDEMRFVVARGIGHELVRGTALPVAECLVSRAAFDAVITDGGADGAEWIAPDGEESRVLLCPILHDRTLLGMVALADPVCAADFVDHDKDLVRYVCSQLASFIHLQRHRPPEAGRHR